jgi:molecular chaperone GrpE
VVAATPEPGEALMAPAAQAPPPTDPSPALPSTEDLLALLRQERADFRNYRQRVAHERATESERLRGGLLAPLLPVIDDLDRALTEMPAHLLDDPWAQGIGQIRSRIGELQARFGLEAVGEVGERFDPTRHEAVVYEPDPDAAEAILGEVIRPGYAASGRLIRPAQVVVRGPLLNDPTSDQEPTGG